ncbi:MAG: sugar transferase [Bacteroidales bacterium]|nr:sugar transferase [Bacteroidales bacterium]
MKHTLRYILFDFLSAMLAWAAFFLFRKVILEHDFADAGRFFADSNFWLGVIFVPAGWMILYTLQGSYRNVLRKARLKEFQQTLLASFLGVVVIFFALILDDTVESRSSLYFSFLFLFAVHFGLTYSCRLVQTSATVRKVHNRQIGFPTLLVGSHGKAWQTYLDLENQERYSGNLFSGFIQVQPLATDNTPAVPPADSRLTSVMPCLGSIEDIPALVDKFHIDEVIIAIEEGEQQQLQTILRALGPTGTHNAPGHSPVIKITPDSREQILGMVAMDNMFHLPLITIDTRPMEEWQYSIKRLSDIVLSALALLFLSPVFLVTAIVVKCTSPGPVFYVQERIGYLGRPFRMHKFRSMYIDAEEAGPALSRDDDPRITPFGRFMRKVRLDEIPQFYNVLKGTMSLVGYRPERQYYIDQIVQRCPEYLLLQRIKPGITSWGQVKYGYASNVDEMCERLKYDLLYLENMSLSTDLKILIYTIGIIFQGRGK